MSSSSDPGRTIDYVAIDVLRRDPANPQHISEDVVAALDRSIRQCGVVQPAVARREGATVRGGRMAAPRPALPSSVARCDPFHIADD